MYPTVYIPGSRAGKRRTLMTAPSLAPLPAVRRLPAPLFWLVEVVLLAPLALFWVSVIISSDALTRLLFGPSHTLLRDLLTPVILPALALGLALLRLRSSPRTARDRPIVAALVAALVISLVVVLGYAVSENLAEAARR